MLIRRLLLVAGLTLGVAGAHQPAQGAVNCNELIREGKELSPICGGSDGAGRQATGVTLIARPPACRRDCLRDISFQGSMTLNGPGTAAYTFQTSDGATGPAYPLRFPQADTKSVGPTWMSPIPQTSVRASSGAVCGPPLNSAGAAHGNPTWRNRFLANAAYMVNIKYKSSPRAKMLMQIIADGSWVTIKGALGTRAWSDLQSGLTEERPMNNVRLASDELPTPKRGMLPTPKEEIERAKPYIPESEQPNDKPATEPASPPGPVKKDTGSSRSKDP
jgi:hypothetical protein